MKNHRLKTLFSSISIILLLSTRSIPAFANGNGNGNGAKLMPGQITIADFDNGMVNNLGGEIGEWELDPEDTSQGVDAAIDKSVRHGTKGYSLKIAYNVASARNAANGIWMQLNGFNASLYDHFEFWVKGDASKGFTTVFKIEFKKVQPDEEGHEETVK